MQKRVLPFALALRASLHAPHEPHTETRSAHLAICRVLAGTSVPEPEAEMRDWVGGWVTGEAWEGATHANTGSTSESFSALSPTFAECFDDWAQ